MQTLVQADHELTTAIRTWGQPMYGFWKFIANKSMFAFILIALLLSVFKLLVFWQFASVFALAYVLANMLQLGFKRERPDYARLTGYKLRFHTHSFPSGHATMSASAATALVTLTNFSDPQINLFVLVSSVLLAGLIGTSRIMVGVHYLADVVCGWMVGFVLAWVYVVLMI